MNDDLRDARKEAVKTYIEQTKLLVTLASAFLFAPAGLIAILKDRTAAHLTAWQIAWFVVAEICFIVSVVAGYIVLATIAGSQDIGKFDVNRPATRWWSLGQFLSYVAGLVVFFWLAVLIIWPAPALQCNISWSFNYKRSDPMAQFQIFNMPNDHLVIILTQSNSGQANISSNLTSKAAPGSPQQGDITQKPFVGEGNHLWLSILGSQDGSASGCYGIQ